MAEAFARPALELAQPQIGNLDVAAAPTGGQGLALDETGRVPASALGVIKGRVSAAGVIEAGTGFTVAKTGTGQYTMTFAAPFAAIPIVVASGDAQNMACVATVATTSFDIQIRTVSTAGAPLADEKFSFIATAV